MFGIKKTRFHEITRNEYKKTKFCFQFSMAALSLFTNPLDVNAAQINAHYIVDKKDTGMLAIIRNRKHIFSELSEKLAHYGLNIDNQHSSPNVIFCHRVNDEISKKGIPIILLDINSYSSFPGKSFPENSNIAAVFKHYIFKFPDLYSWQFDIEYHGIQINKYANLFNFSEPIMAYDSTMIRKIRCCPWLLELTSLSTKRRPLVESPPPLDNERVYDVSFCGIQDHTMPGKMTKLYTWHRNRAVQEIEKLNVNKLVHTSTYPGPKPLPYEKYINIMKNSKIVVSPWGMAEFCHRDFEAWLCGAVLIKPDTDYLTSVRNYYQSGVTYVACKPDFSDLKEKVDHILRNWDSYRPMRKRAQDLVIYGWSIDDCLKHFVKNVQEVIS